MNINSVDIIGYVILDQFMLKSMKTLILCSHTLANESEMLRFQAPEILPENINLLIHQSIVVK